MSDQHVSHVSKLEKVGLSNAEARIYLALVSHGAPLGASALVQMTSVPRSSVYPALSHLSDIGIVNAEAGYGGRFAAVPPKEALPSLIGRAREDLSKRETLARQLVEHLESFAQEGEKNGEAEVIQVLRDPRVIGERFDRLQHEVKRQIEVFTKAPFFMQPGNPEEDQVLRRGVRARSLYERAVLATPEIGPYLKKWLAKGEEARVHDGDLPHKLALFDRENILMPLITPHGVGRTLFVKSPQLGESLGLLFDFLWEKAQPITPAITDVNGSAANGTRVRHPKTGRSARPAGSK